jgi:hypothetical protein
VPLCPILKNSKKISYLFISYYLHVSSCADALGATLATHLDKPCLYIGCMKSGEVFSEK